MALPLNAEEDDLEFVHIAADDLHTFDGRLRIWSVVAAKNASETLCCDLHLKAGCTLQIDTEAEERAIYVVDGTLEIDGSNFVLGQLIILSSKVACRVKAESHALFVVIGGTAMEGPRYRSEGW